MSTTVGQMDPPLGNTRLQVAKLIAILLARDTWLILIDISVRLGRELFVIYLFYTSIILDQCIRRFSLIFPLRRVISAAVVLLYI